MPTKIAIIGVGNIGFRHFQALSLLNDELEIQAVDILPQNLARLNEEYEKIGKKTIKLETCESISQLNDEIDYAIVATSSAVRRAVTEELLAKKKVAKILFEKVLFQKTEDYEAVGKMLEEKGVKAWVNCARRMNNSYKELNRLLGGKRFEAVVTGSNWGLGCNAIHIIDILYYLASTSANIVCNADMLDNEILQSKREGYVEFTGTISGSIGDRVNFSVTSLNQEPSPIVIYIFSDDKIYIIKEAEQKMFEYTNGSVVDSAFEMPYLSTQGADIARAILFDNNCTLPTYESSSKIHISMLNALLNKMEKIQGRRQEICKIT